MKRERSNPPQIVNRGHYPVGEPYPLTLSNYITHTVSWYTVTRTDLWGRSLHLVAQSVSRITRYQVADLVT